jgi:hypothetical protein
MRTNDFIIDPFVGATPLRFGMNEKQVEECLGPPEYKGTNWQKKPHWSYYSNPELNVGFTIESGLVVHLGFGKSSHVTYEGMDLFREPNVIEILLEKHDAFFWVGFVVFHGIGLAFDNFHTKTGQRSAIVAFPQGNWDHSIKRSKPFGLADLESITV